VSRRDLMGVDTLIRTTDLPRRESEHSRSHAVIDKNFAGAPADETYRTVVGNVINVVDLGPARYSHTGGLPPYPFTRSRHG
jgi:hypothetical protein